MAKKAIVFLAEGFEEVEALTPIDYLRRAGIAVTTSSITSSRTVTGARGVPVVADTLVEELAGRGKLTAAAWDAVFIPGGMPGASNLAACSAVGSLFREMAAAGKIFAAICASPAVVLAPLGLLDGKNFTCFPGLEGTVKGGKHSTEKVVIDGSLVTSRGPGTAADFALALIEKLAGSPEAKKIAADTLLEPAAGSV
ncbi:MAG: DJ-1/PfpI family protein [Treponema sp.]|jgi:4-methyl-5(b-hydroxyethyl)-thiazole monophosphate biosynthesis|nr:DJ-1/PfpI family protein [Treponema sp.]